MGRVVRGLLAGAVISIVMLIALIVIVASST
jgi:hypothetical protein